MAITANNAELAFYHRLLKGNTVSGAANLEHILLKEASAQELISNTAALTVLYGSMSGNSRRLFGVLNKRGYGKLGLTAYLNFFYGWNFTCFEEMLENKDTMNTLIKDDRAMNAIIHTQEALDAVAANEAAIKAVVENLDCFEFLIDSRSTALAIVENKGVMEAILANRPATDMIMKKSVIFDAIVNSATAMEFVLKNDYAGGMFFNSKALVGRGLDTYVGGFSNTSVASQATFYNIYTSATYATELVNSEKVMDAIFSCGVARNIVLTYATMLQYITVKPKLMVQIMEDETLRGVFFKATNYVGKGIDAYGQYDNTIIAGCTTVSKVLEQAAIIATNRETIELLMQSTAWRDALFASNYAGVWLNLYGNAGNTDLGNATTLANVFLTAAAVTAFASNEVLMDIVRRHEGVRRAFLGGDYQVGKGLDTLGSLNNAALVAIAKWSAVITSEASMKALAGNPVTMEVILADKITREDFFNGSFSVGLGLCTYAGIENETLKSLHTIDAILASPDAMEAVINNSKALSVVMSAVSAGKKLIESPRQVGVAISNYFGIDNEELRAAQTIAPILSEKMAYDEIFNSEALMQALGNSAAATEIIASNPEMLLHIMENRPIRKAFGAGKAIHGCYDTFLSTLQDKKYFKWLGYEMAAADAAVNNYYRFSVPWKKSVEQGPGVCFALVDAVHNYHSAKGSCVLRRLDDVSEVIHAWEVNTTTNNQTAVKYVLTGGAYGNQGRVGCHIFVPRQRRS